MGIVGNGDRDITTNMVRYDRYETVPTSSHCGFKRFGIQRNMFETGYKYPGKGGRWLSRPWAYEPDVPMTQSVKQFSRTKGPFFLMFPKNIY